VEPEQTSIAKQWLGKHIPAGTNTHATIEEPNSKQRIGKHTKGVLLEAVFSVRSVKGGWEELVEFQSSRWADSWELMEAPEMAVEDGREEKT
jgi:hypothetical protein